VLWLTIASGMHPAPLHCHICATLKSGIYSPPKRLLPWIFRLKLLLPVVQRTPRNSTAYLCPLPIAEHRIISVTDQHVEYWANDLKVKAWVRIKVSGRGISRVVDPTRA